MTRCTSGCGQHIADGKWLGPYTALTLFKGPGYPLFLAASSLTGVSFNTVQYLLFFLSSMYFATVMSSVSCAKRWFYLIFILVLMCPAYYAILRVLREPVYTSLTLALIAASTSLLFRRRRATSSLVPAVGVGLLAGLYWVTREEGIWILPSLGVLTFAALLAGVSGLCRSAPLGWTYRCRGRTGGDSNRWSDRSYQ